jgi:hypothetical protein
MHVLTTGVTAIDAAGIRRSVPFVNDGVELHAGVSAAPSRFGKLPENMTRFDCPNGFTGADSFELWHDGHMVDLLLITVPQWQVFLDITFLVLPVFLASTASFSGKLNSIFCILSLTFLRLPPAAAMFRL